MRIVKLLFLFLCFTSSESYITRKNTRHVTVEFAKQPKNRKQRLDWIHGIKNAINDVNQELERRAHILPSEYPFKPTEQDSLLRSLWKRLKNMYYHVFFHTDAIAYKGKKNKAFITRRNDEMGSVAIYVPDGVTEKVFIVILRKMLAKHGVDATIETDHHVVLTSNFATSPLGYTLFDGKPFTLTELNSLLNSRQRDIQKEIQLILDTKRNSFSQAAGKPVTLTDQQIEFLLNKFEKKQLQTKKDLLEQQQLFLPYLFWWQSIPTTGLRLEKPFWPLAYPFLPHAFPLWQLAPKMGAGVKVFVVDSGFAAFDIDWEPYFRKNQDLQMIADFTQQPSYNLVSSEDDLLDPAEQLAQLIESHTAENKRDLAYLQTLLPDWIRAYLQNKSTDGVQSYLLSDGKPEYSKVVDGKQELTPAGQAALQEIIQGEAGFHTKGKDKPNFTLVNIGAPNNQQDAILEFIPTAMVGEIPFDQFSTSSALLDDQWLAAYTSGHGTHTSGIIGARLQSAIPSIINQETVAQMLAQDTGICGVAPLSDMVMLKVFKSTGNISNRSIVSQGIARAQQMGAEVINLSIKIDDQMDSSELEVKSLQDTIAAIPYVAAASGNALKDAAGNYSANKEGYPARFASVAFDVGAFSFYQDKNGDYQCPIPPFSQYQAGIGPKFVAPGQNILSCGLSPDQTEDSVYVFMEGTSASTPMLSGFNALMLSEFKGVFTEKERAKLLTICYNSTLRMHDDDDWNKKTLLGALDFRTVLFKLHVLKKLKSILAAQTITYTPTGNAEQKLDFERDFNRLAEAIHQVLFGMVNEFARVQKIEASFENNFMGYFNSACKKGIVPDRDIFTSLDKALDFVTNVVLYAANEKSVSTKPDIDPTTLGQVQQIFKEETVKPFEHLADIPKRRIQSVDVNFK